MNNKEFIDYMLEDVEDPHIDSYFEQFTVQDIIELYKEWSNA